jgi:hypothetical protein
MKIGLKNKKYMNEKDLKQGTRVEYNPYPNSDKNIILTGKICGLANTGAAIIGKGYIIELDEQSKKIIPEYPYSHLIGFEVFLKEL